MPGKAKVVAAYLDGRRLKGYTNDFSPARDHFFLFPEGAESQPGRGTPVQLAELKALFFVKEFAGDPTHIRLADTAQGPGKKIEVSFRDSETMTGFSLAYNPKAVGFFLQPDDSTGNNERVFVVNRNVKLVRVL